MIESWGEREGEKARDSVDARWDLFMLVMEANGVRLMGNSRLALKRVEE